MLEHSPLVHSPIVHSPIVDVAGCLVTFLVLVALHRWAFRVLEKKACCLASNWRSCFLVTANYYTLLYAVYVPILIYLEYNSAFTILYETKWLDPVRLNETFHDETNLPNWTFNELQHMIGERNHPGSGMLRYFSLLSLPFVVLTFIVSAYNTFRHVRQVLRRGGGLIGNPGVDSTIIIIALPLIACLMAFRCVTRMWMICANSDVGSLSYAEDFQFHHTWEARLVLCQVFFKANLMITDVYESWALLHFATLSLKVINAQKKEKLRKALTQRDSLGDSNVQLSQQQQALQSQLGIEGLTYQGIYLFNFTCVLEASYYFVVTMFEAFNSNARIMQLDYLLYLYKEPAHFFFLGMGTISSAAAIGNVVTVESTFEEFLHRFGPKPKFWSTKILVTLAFLQSLLLEVPPLSYLSVTEQNLVYASALCIECFLLSLLHLRAWKPGEDWYGDLRAATCRNMHDNLESSLLPAGDYRIE